MSLFPKKLTARLVNRKRDNTFRKLPDEKPGIDFSSNDYLGFTDLKEKTLLAKDILSFEPYKEGATGSRLISGNHVFYKIAEKEIADFHGIENALVFNSGYDANVGFFSSVPQKGDVVLFDAFIHASIRDGIKMSNADAWKFKHNDIADLNNKLNRASNRYDTIYVVTESVFSMDGDSPNLFKIVECCSKYKALLVVDEAHAIGIFGEQGEGILASIGLQNEVFATIVTFGKALGCHGAAVLGSDSLKEYLINFARSLIYTTALPPHSLANIIAGYRILKTNHLPYNTLRKRIIHFKSEIKNNELTSSFIESDSAIQCALIPGVDNVKRFSSLLNNNGFNVKPIIAPTVAKGSERLRFCLHSYNSDDDISTVLKLLATFVNNNLINSKNE